KEYDLKDVLLAKEANINFIRTSHYPPTKRFVEYCDQYGIYLEDETAVCFIASFRKNSTPKHSEAVFENRYISQLKEMLNAHRNHPSVIIWSIGNESTYNQNFQKSYEYLKKADTTRPVIFSYPGTVVKGNKCFDLLSFHYPNLAGVTATGWGANKDHQYVEHDFESDTIPVLYDEWAHVACYNYTTLLNDPNVRDFWGKSLDEMWERSYNSEGALGGAIWGMVDEVFLLPENVSLDNSDQRVEIMPRENSLATGYGEWGIFDVWRRKKPEFWNTKKAYSPAKILLNKLPYPVEGKDLLIPVQNRFNHTNFNEIDIKWSYKNKSGKIEGVDILPRQQG
ncbi:MAG: beta-galactosidase, partial [Bacteroidales bacterium]|nr:beta-galactosidase [Bacteroidales bacterium]